MKRFRVGGSGGGHYISEMTRNGKEQLILIKLN